MDFIKIINYSLLLLFVRFIYLNESDDKKRYVLCCFFKVVARAQELAPENAQLLYLSRTHYSIWDILQLIGEELHESTFPFFSQRSSVSEPLPAFASNTVAPGHRCIGGKHFTFLLQTCGSVPISPPAWRLSARGRRDRGEKSSQGNYSSAVHNKFELPPQKQNSQRLQGEMYALLPSLGTNVTPHSIMHVHVKAHSLRINVAVLSCWHLRQLRRRWVQVSSRAISCCPRCQSLWLSSSKVSHRRVPCCR